MKKVVTISIILSIVLALGVVESVCLSKYYKGIYNDLSEIDEILVSIGNDADLSIVENKAKAILSKWESKKTTLHAVSNHTIVRSFEEKLVSLVTWIECDGYADTRMLCASAMEIAKELAQESRPQIGNLF